MSCLEGLTLQIITVQECIWTNLQGEYRSWNHLRKRDCQEPSLILLSVPMHSLGDKNQHKMLGRKWKMSSEDARKEEEPARQGYIMSLRQEWNHLYVGNWLQQWMLTGLLPAGLCGRLMLQHARGSEVLSLAKSWNRGRRGHAKGTRAKTSVLCPAS